MGKQQSVYHARSAKAIGEAIPEFATTIVDLIVGSLVNHAANYSVYAPGPFQVPEFDFLYTDKKKVSTVFLNCPAPTPIATIKGIVLTNQVDTTLQSLLEMAKPSLVGKNEKTELDETVRKSSEILADQIELDADFFAMISQEIQALAQTLGHPTKVMAKLHKLVVYQKGDFFDTHIDSPHNNAEPMIFTASVHLSNYYRTCSGGQLVVGNFEIRSPEFKELGLTLFYHDEPHSVTKVDSGHRVSLVFDVVDLGTPTATPVSSSVAVPEVLSKMFSLGFNKVAIRTSHTYFSSRKVSPEQLKGTDKVFYELMMTHGAKCVEICEVFEDEERIYRREVLEVMQLGSGFGCLYDSAREDSDEEEERKGKRQRCGEKEENSKMKRTRVEYDHEISPLYDDNSNATAIKSKYRLGDALFLSAVTPRVLAYSSREGVHLGNQGFYGKIFSNLAIIARF